MHHIWRRTQNQGQKNCLKNCSKDAKIVITVIKFSGKHVLLSPDTPEFFFCFSICIKVTLPEKNTLKKRQNQNLMSYPTKKSEYAPDTKHFQRAYLPPFPGINVQRFCTWFTFNQFKTAPPPPNQNFVDLLLRTTATLLILKCFRSCISRPNRRKFQ